MEPYSICALTATVGGKAYAQTIPPADVWYKLCQKSFLFYWHSITHPFLMCYEHHGQIVYMLSTDLKAPKIVGCVREDGHLYKEDPSVPLYVYYRPALIPLGEDNLPDTKRYQDWETFYGGSFTMDGQEFGHDCRAAYCTPQWCRNSDDLLIHDHSGSVSVPGKGELKWRTMDGVLVCDRQIALVSMERLFDLGRLPFYYCSIQKN